MTRSAKLILNNLGDATTGTGVKNTTGTGVIKKNTTGTGVIKKRLDDNSSPENS